MKYLLSFLFLIIPFTGWTQKFEYHKLIDNANSLIFAKKFDLALIEYSRICDSMNTEYDSRNKYLLTCQLTKALLYFEMNHNKIGCELMNNFLVSFFIDKKVDKELYHIVDKAIFKYFKGNLNDTVFILKYLEQSIQASRETFGVNDIEYHNKISEYILFSTSFVRMYKFLDTEFKNWNLNETVMQQELNNNYWAFYNKWVNKKVDVYEKDATLYFYNFIDKSLALANKYHYNDTISAYYLSDKAIQSINNGDNDKALKLFIESKNKLEAVNYKENYYRSIILKIVDLLFKTNDIKSAREYLTIVENDYEKYTTKQQNDFCFEKVILEAYKQNGLDGLFDFNFDSIEKIYGCHIDKNYFKIHLIHKNYKKYVDLSNSEEDNSGNLDYKYLLSNFNVEISKATNFYYNYDYAKANKIIENLKKFLKFLDSIQYDQSNLVYYDMLFSVNVLSSKIKKYTNPNEKTLIYRDLIDKNLKLYYSVPNLPQKFIFNTYDYLQMLANGLGLYEKALSYNDTCIYYLDNKLSDYDTSSLMKGMLNDTKIYLLHKLSKINDQEYLDNLIKSFKIYNQKLTALNISDINEILDYAFSLKKHDILKEYTNKYVTQLKYELSYQWVFMNISQQEKDLKYWGIDLDLMNYYIKNLKIDNRLNNDIYSLRIGLRSLDIGNITYLANYKQSHANSYYNIKKLQDLSINYSKMTLSELAKIKITEDSIAELQKNINFQITKLLLQSNKTPIDIDKYNLDSIRKYLKEDECYLFHYYETINEYSNKRVKDFIGYLYGFRFNTVNDGLIIESISEESPASFVLKPTDRIIQVNSKTISNIKEMTDEVYSSSSMNIKIIRENDTLNYKLKRDSIFQTSNYLDDVFVIIDKENSDPKVLSYLIKSEKGDNRYWGTLLQNYSKGLQKVKDERTYDVIFKPLFEEIKKYKTIYYTLSGILNNFNIEQVFDTDNKKYLSDEFEFHSCPTLEDYYQIKKSGNGKTSNKNIAIFGNPDFSKFSDALSANTNRSAWEDMSYYYSDSISKVSFSNLPYTKYEIDEINKIGKSNGYIPIQYEGKLCSETSIKNLASPFILHVATHGYYFNNSNNTFVNKYSSISNDLFNTGLILTEANANTNEINDGFLSAYEVLDLNLKNTELVVLSACETSLASYNYTGSDVNSLQRSFRIAGAKAVLASKWKVPDKQTGELMVEFYTNWLEKKMTKHQALQQAQLTLRKKYPEPYYWAAWVLYGE